MTSTSHDGVVVRDTDRDGIGAPRPVADLRTGRWTRLGGTGVLGDAVTEAALSDLAERTRDAARAQGYAAGWAEGYRVARANAEEATRAAAATDAEERARWKTDLDLALGALLHAVQRLDRTFQERTAELTARAHELALAIAGAVLDREVHLSETTGADALRRALSPLDRDSTVTVRMHPDDIALLDPTALRNGSVHLVHDVTLQRGDAVATTEDTIVDATIATALDRVREVLAR